MTIETRLTIRIDESKRKQLHDKAKKEGKTATDVMIELIDSYLGISKGDKVSQLEERIAGLEKKLGERVARLEEKLGESAA